MTDYKFQVNLGGVLDLLSNHIYSSPQVFVRELLQNAVDAITARRLSEPGHVGEVSIELPAPEAGGGRPSLVFTDNGTGLTEDEIHRFLATIGETSKRDGEGAGPPRLYRPVRHRPALVLRRERGDFGADTLRENPARASVEWRGRSDGSTPSADRPRDGAGTTVRLLCKEGARSIRRGGGAPPHAPLREPLPTRQPVAGAGEPLLVNDDGARVAAGVHRPARGTRRRTSNTAAGSRDGLPRAVPLRSQSATCAARPPFAATDEFVRRARRTAST